MKENFYLPKDTFGYNIQENQIENFALRLNKFPKVYVKKEKLNFSLSYHENNNKKNIHINCEVDHNFNDSKKSILEFSAKYLFHLNKIPNIKLETSYFKPDWKMIVGLGGGSVYETSITLHHIYGFPYIPGQAIKGIVRNYVISEYFNQDEENAEKDNSFVKIFGTQTQTGEVTFFDAYPISEPKIDFDIMNVHYPDYYSKSKEPTDNQNPNPIHFLTVKYTTFAFIIGYEDKNSEKIDFSKFKEESLSELLQNVLEEKGVGAKTAVGYGYFEKEKHFNFSEYEKLLKKEKEEIEKNKPLWKKIIDNKLIEKGIEYIQKNDDRKENVVEMLKDYFQDKTVWEKKKLNGQHFDFANIADKFLGIIYEKDNNIVNLIKEFGGNELKNKYKRSNSSSVNVKIPNSIKEVENTVEQLQKAEISFDDFEKIERKIVGLLKKDKKNKLKKNKKDIIIVFLKKMREKYLNQ